MNRYTVNLTHEELLEVIDALLWKRMVLDGSVCIPDVNLAELPDYLTALPLVKRLEIIDGMGERFCDLEAEQPPRTGSVSKVRRPKHPGRADCESNQLAMWPARITRSRTIPGGCRAAKPRIGCINCSNSNLSDKWIERPSLVIQAKLFPRMTSVNVT